MRAAAEKGDYGLALRLMMASLLRWLADRNVLRLHEGKTNGDYVREYSPQRDSRNLFRKFVIAFDTLTYGRRACGGRELAALSSAFKKLRADVQREQ